MLGPAMPYKDIGAFRRSYRSKDLLQGKLSALIMNLRQRTWSLPTMVLQDF